MKSIEIEAQGPSAISNEFKNPWGHCLEGLLR